MSTTVTQPAALLTPERITRKGKELQAWRFLETPNSWYLKIPAGALLYEASAASPVWTGRSEAWSVEARGTNGKRLARGIPEKIARAFLAEDQLRHDPELCAARLLVSDPSDTAFVNLDLPELGIRRGDVLSLATGLPWAPFPDFYGSTRALTLNDYAALRAACDSRGAGIVLTSLSPLSDYDFRTPPLVELLRARRQWGRPGPKWRSRVMLVRPQSRADVRPIAAGNDEGALAALLAEVGGRMPEGGDQ